MPIASPAPEPRKRYNLFAKPVNQARDGDQPVLCSQNISEPSARAWLDYMQRNEPRREAYILEAKPQ